jgi:hypothetical protein
MLIIESDDPQDIIALFCGPRQHDTHMQKYRWHLTMLAVNPNYLADIARRQEANRAAGIGPEGRCQA